MYLNYKNSKITIADYDPDYGPGGADPKEFFAQDISLDLNATISPTYTTDKRYSYIFAPDDGINGVLSISYLITGDDPLKDYIINDSGTNSHYRTLSGNFGGLNFSSGYLTNYSLSFSPNSKLAAQASIKFFGALSGQHTKSSKYSHGVTDGASQGGDAAIFNVQDVKITSNEVQDKEIFYSVDNISSLSYSYQSQVDPSYEIGEILPSHVVFGQKNVTANLELDSLSGDLPVYGKTADFKITLAHPDVPDFTLEYPVSGAISRRNIKTSVGQLIKTDLTVQQSFFGECPTVTNTVGAHAWGSTYGLTGTNFVDVTRITLNGREIEDFTVVSKTLINFKVPEGASSGPISVFTEGCEFGTASSSNVTVTDPGIKITAYYESNRTTESYVARYLDQIIIKGEYFNDVDHVYFVRDTGPQGDSGTSGQNMTMVDAEFQITSTGPESEIKAIVPENCMSGHVTMKSTSRGDVKSTNDAHLNGRHFVPFPVITKATFSNSNRPRGLITLQGHGFSSMVDPLGDASGSVGNLPLGRLSGATSSGFEVLNETGEAIGNNRLLMAAPKNAEGYPAGKITISGASGVFASAPVDYIPEVFISGISASVSKSSLVLPRSHIASGQLNTSIRITGQNFFTSLLDSVTPHHSENSLAYSVDYNGETGIVYPDSSSPNSILTGTVPFTARSGLLRIRSAAGEVHPSGMLFSPVMPAPVINSISSLSGVAGDTITISGHYFSNATALKLIKRSTSKASDESISGFLYPRDSGNVETENALSSEAFRVLHGGVSGFSSHIGVSKGLTNSADIITFPIPTGFRGAGATAGTAGSAGTAGTSFDVYEQDAANFLFTGHGIFDVVIETSRGGYTTSGSLSSGLVVMGEPTPSGCYVNTDEINSAHHGDFVNRSITGVIGDEIIISGDNLYPNSKVYLNDFEGDNAKAIPARSLHLPTVFDSTDSHIRSGQYTGLAFNIPPRTGLNPVPMAATGIKFFVQTPKSVVPIKSYDGKNWPLTVQTHKPVGPQDIMLFLPPTISGFEPKFASEGETIKVSGAFLTGISQVFVGETEITDDNYLKTKNASLAADWQNRDNTVATIEKSIYGTSFSFQVPTGIRGGSLNVQATGGNVISDEVLTMIDPVPTIHGFSPKALGFDRPVYLSGSNLNQVRKVYISGIRATYLQDDIIAPNSSEYFEDGFKFNQDYYVEVPCNGTLLDGGSATGIKFFTPPNLAKSGYITIESKDGTKVVSDDCLYLSRIEKISPELAFLDDQKIHVKGVNLNYPGLDLRFRGAWNPRSEEEEKAQDYRFVHPSGAVKYHGASYENTSWGATGAYFYPNRETQCDSIYLTSGSKISETKATGPHEKYFTNSYGMVVDQSKEAFIPQPEISGEFRKLIPGPNKTYSCGGKYGLVNHVFAVGEQFYFTGVNCFDVSRNIVATWHRPAFTARDGNFQGWWDEAIFSKFLTKNLSGGFDNTPKYLISNKQGGTYYDLLTGSLSGSLTGSLVSDFDAGYVVMSGTFGEGMINPYSFIGAIMAGEKVSISLSLCSKCDTNCNIDEEVILDDGLNYAALDAPRGGSLGNQSVNCGDLDSLPEAAQAKNAQDRINQHILSQDC